MKKLLILTLALLLLLPAAYAQQEDMYFPQPEDSILYFVDRINNQDIGGAADSMATQSAAAHFDTQKYLVTAKGLYPNTPNRFLGDDPQFQGLNAQINRANNLLSVHGLLSSLALPDMPDNQRFGALPMTPDGLFAVSEGEALTLEEYTARFAPANFAGLELQELYENTADALKGGLNQRNAAIYGALDSGKYIAIYAFNGQLFQHGFTLVQYPEGWQILKLSAPMSGTSPMGSAQKIDQKALDALQANPIFAKVFPAE